MALEDYKDDMKTAAGVQRVNLFRWRLSKVTITWKLARASLALIIALTPGAVGWALEWLYWKTNLTIHLQSCVR